MTGSVRVTSKRKNGLAPDPGEIVIEIDRTNPVLGNPHVLRDHRDAKERQRVIAAYAADLEADFADHGPKYHACAEIAERVKTGQRIALQCWCKQPVKSVPCHGDLLREKILTMAGIKNIGIDFHQMELLPADQLTG